MQFSQRLKKLMDKNGLTKYELAKRLDVHPTTITNWLEGGKYPRMKTQRALAEFFDVSVDYLMGDEEEPILVNNDPELTEYLETLRTRPEMRMMFSLAKSASKDDVEKAVKIIELFLADK